MNPGPSTNPAGAGSPGDAGASLPLERPAAASAEPATDAQLDPPVDPPVDPKADPHVDLHVDLPARPYPGLRPFERDEWPVFFGREGVIDTVLERLIDARMIFIHGDSGCGKSSLVRAGLFAQLEQGRAGAGWRTATALPREAPLWNLATALAELAEGPAPQRATMPGTVADAQPAAAAAAAAAFETRVLDWRRALDFGPEAPAALAELYARSAHGGQPACLLIDQFEELFEHARKHGPAEADALTAALTAWQTSPPRDLYLAVTMRSEYLGACARHGGFAQAVNATQYLLPRMTTADMERAIREPARLFDGEVSRELAERLIADTRDTQNRGADQLPLIQHALMRLHGALHTAPGQRWQLGLADFPAQGGCAGLLSAHAEEVRTAFEQAHPEHTRLTEDVLRALTDINADGHAVRRPRTLAELAAVSGADVNVVRDLVDGFRADGVSFMTPPPGRALRPATRVDIGHEALIRCWHALAEPKDGWLVREFRNGLVWRALLVQAESYERDPEAVLNPTTTDEREQWMQRRNAAWAERYGGGWERVQALLAGSIAKREADRARALAQQRRKLGTLGLVVVALVGAAGGYAALSRANERVQRVNFEAQQRMAEQSQEATVSLAKLQGELEQRSAELARLRDELQALQTAARSTTNRADLSERIGAAASTLERQITQLKTDTTTPAYSANPPRLYVHIAEEAQRALLQAAWKQLAQKTISGERIIVPGIELVRNAPSRAVLRCFEASECANEAPLLRDAVNAVLRTPQVVVEDLSQRYGGGTRANAGVRPRHYELWLPEGTVVMR